MSERAVSDAPVPETSADRAATPVEGDLVRVRLPATSAYLSVLRTAAAGLAARLDFTLDEIEDLRIAVDEATAMLLPQALPGSDLMCSFELEPDALRIDVRVPTERGIPPSRHTFSWTVLTALAGEVDSGVEDDSTVWISLHKRRAHGAPP